MIYTIGYQSTTILNIERAIRALDATLIDIRLAARSYIPEYRLNTLAARFGNKYIHVPELGNINYKDDTLPQVIRDFDAGLSIVQAVQSPNVILMCACASPYKCHRLLIRQRLLALGIPAQELLAIPPKTTPAYHQGLLQL